MRGGGGGIYDAVPPLRRGKTSPESGLVFRILTFWTVFGRFVWTILKKSRGPLGLFWACFGVRRWPWPRGFQEPQDGLQEAQDGPKMAPRWPKMGPRWAQEGPRWPQEGPRWLQEGPKMGQEAAKLAPGGPEVGQRSPQVVQRSLQDGFKPSEGGSKIG